MSGHETMRARERVVAAINHRQPDRMPIDLGLYTASGISAFAYRNLRRHLGLSTDQIELYEGVQCLARVDEDVLELLHADCILLKPRAARYRIWQPRGDYRFQVPDYYQPQLNEQGEWVVTAGRQRMRMPRDGYFFDGDWIQFEDPWRDDVFPRYVAEAERLFKETDYFTAFKGLYPFFNSNMDYFCDMITDPEPLIEQNRQIVKRELERAARFVRFLAPYVGAVCLSGDLGSQQSPFCHPEHFEPVVLPYLKQVCDFIHQNSDAKVFLHSCGAIEPLLPLLIEAGIDIINPVQISAAGMDAAGLKRKYGDQIVFWGGGANTQQVLGMLPPDVVRDHVRGLVQTFKPGGGYVFCPVHNILGNVQPESILAAYVAAYDASFYEVNT
ncbi:MAG: hypothetical protein GX112_03790 [Clostridiaceae bacterium]|nr:hypothetical protein [Clostridiaceae bacterium]